MDFPCEWNNLVLSKCVFIHAKMCIPTLSSCIFCMGMQWACMYEGRTFPARTWSKRLIGGDKSNDETRTTALCACLAMSQHTNK